MYGQKSSENQRVLEIQFLYGFFILSGFKSQRNGWEYSAGNCTPIEIEFLNSDGHGKHKKEMRNFPCHELLQQRNWNIKEMEIVQNFFHDL